MLRSAWISTLFRGIWMYPVGGLSRETSEESCPANDPSEAFGADRDTSGTDRADTACRAGGSSGLDAYGNSAAFAPRCEQARRL